MSERTLRFVGAALAALGAAITGYLLYVRETGGELVCTTGGCDTVQSSAYAEVLGAPVALLGLMGFLALLVTALARGDLARLSQATIALAAFTFSGYLLFIQLAVIDAVCQWCLATDVLTTAIGVLALLRLRVVAHAAADSAGPVGAATSRRAPAVPARARSGRARRGSRRGASA